MTLKGIFKPFSKINYTKVSILFFFVALWLLWTTINAYAEVLYQQPVESVCITIPSNTTYPLASTSLWTATQTGVIANFDMVNSCGGPSNDSYWLIYSATSTLLYTSPTRPNEMWRNTSAEPNGNVLDGITIYAGQEYKITSHTITGNGNSNSWFASSTDGGLTYAFALTLSGTSTDYINIVYPTSTQTADFNSWHIDYGFSTSTLINAGHSVKYSQNLSGCVGYNNGSGCYWDFEPTHTQNEIYAPVVKLNDLPVGSYQAQAFLHNDEVDVATSSIISFYITGQPPISSLFVMPTSTWATSTLPIQITCDPNDNFFQYSFCKLLTFLFVPNSDTLNKFSTLTSGITTKAPLGYFTSITEAIGDFSSSSPAFALDIDENDPFYTTFLDPIRTGLTWILWLALAFWIFHRFRHFNLTSP
jgi:hypothetical protein